MRAIRLLLLGLLVACSGNDGASSDAGAGVDDTGPTERLTINELEAVETPANVLAYEVSWRTSAAATSDLLVNCDGLAPWTLSSDKIQQQHRVFVMGLLSQARCKLTASGRAGDQRSEKGLTLTVGDLPDFLPSIERTVTPSDGAMQEGWTLINLSNAFDRVPYTVALIDEQGRYRWYHQHPITASGSDTPVVYDGDGVLVGGRDVDLASVDWRGRIRWEGPRGHHEVRPNDEGQIYYLVDKECSALEHRACSIERYDPTDARDVWSWHYCDHYTPPVDRADWSHCNTVAPFPGEDAILLSSRNQNALAKVELSSGALVWSMGFNGAGNGDFTGDFEMAPEDRFYQQHDPEVQADGNILLFDNGHPTQRRYSRAIEIAYTFVAAGTSRAEVVWEYRHDPDLYTPIWGDADRLANGNTLVTFGFRSRTERTAIVEVSPAGKAVWQLRLPPKWGTYRSERVPDPPRGFVDHD